MLLAVGLCAILLTHAVTLIWVGITVAAFVSGATSGSSSGLVALSGLTIAAAFVDFIGIVVTTVAGRQGAQR